MDRSKEIHAPDFGEEIPTVDPSDLRVRIDAAIETLISLLDAIDAPLEDCEPSEDHEDDDPSGVPY